MSWPALADRRIRATQEELVEALRGHLTASPPLPVRASSRTDRRPRPGDRPDRPGGGGRTSNSFRETIADRKDDPRHRRPQRAKRSVRDRHRHEPIPLGRPSRLLGRLCARATTRAPARDDQHACARESRWLKDNPLSVRLGSRQNQRQLLPGPVPPNQGPPRRQEGHRRRRCLPAAHHLPHAQGRDALPGPRRRSLRQADTRLPPPAASFSASRTLGSLSNSLRPPHDASLVSL